MHYRHVLWISEFTIDNSKTILHFSRDILGKKEIEGIEPSDDDKDESINIEE
jgi:hypothetical protein